MVEDSTAGNPALTTTDSTHQLTLNAPRPPQRTTIMSFGFGIGDMVVVSRALVKLYTAIHDAPIEQQTLLLEVEILRHLVGQIAAQTPTTLSPPATVYSSLGSQLSMTTAPARQLSRCLELLQCLDAIALDYMGNTSSDQTAEKGKKSRSRLFRWGLYKRKEFVQLLGDLRNVTDLLQSLQQIGNIGPVPAVVFQNGATHVELIDALDRMRVCSFDMCDTWEVFRPLPLTI